MKTNSSKSSTTKSPKKKPTQTAVRKKTPDKPKTAEKKQLKAPGVKKAAPVKKSPIYLFVFFGFNYSHDFIQKAWAHDKNLASHLKEKFNHLYHLHGNKAVMFSFYVELSSSNRKILEDWVVKNFKG